MKKFFLAVLLVLALCPRAFAHPPSSMEVTYDPYTKTVRASIVHQVGDPQSHSIGKVVVVVSGREAIRQQCRRQDDARGLTVAYRLPDAQPGDVITVEAYCTLGGEMKKDVTVPSSP